MEREYDKNGVDMGDKPDYFIVKGIIFIILLIYFVTHF